jgi:hypothetical protein
MTYVYFVIAVALGIGVGVVLGIVNCILSILGYVKLLIAFKLELEPQKDPPGNSRRLHIAYACFATLLIAGLGILLHLGQFHLAADILPQATNYIMIPSAGTFLLLLIMIWLMTSGLLFND